MSRKRNNQYRALPLLIALLQLSMLPATCVLHLDCTHHAGLCHSSAAAGSASCAHPCLCGHDHASPASASLKLPATGPDNQTTENGRQDGPQNGHHNKPHDHESCRICQSAFALTTVDFAILTVEATDSVRLLSCQTEAVPATPRRYRWLSRGPPC